MSLGLGGSSLYSWNTPSFRTMGRPRRSLMNQGLDLKSASEKFPAGKRVAKGMPRHAHFSVRGSRDLQKKRKSC